MVDAIVAEVVAHLELAWVFGMGDHGDSYEKNVLLSLLDRLVETGVVSEVALLESFERRRGNLPPYFEWGHEYAFSDRTQAPARSSRRRPGYKERSTLNILQRLGINGASSAPLRHTARLFR